MRTFAAVKNSFATWCAMFSGILHAAALVPFLVHIPQALSTMVSFAELFLKFYNFRHLAVKTLYTVVGSHLFDFDPLRFASVCCIDVHNSLTKDTTLIFGFYFHCIDVHNSWINGRSPVRSANRNFIVLVYTLLALWREIYHQWCQITDFLWEKYFPVGCLYSSGDVNYHWHLDRQI